VKRILCLPRAARVEILFSVGRPQGEPPEKARKALNEIRLFHEAPRPKGEPPAA
jgi:hypothetical protein